MGGLSSAFDTLVTVGTFGLVNPGQDDALDAQLRSNDAQTAESARQFDAEQAAIAPFRDVGLRNFQTLDQEANSQGQTVEGRLERIRRTFKESPGFQNKLELGKDTIEQGAASQGSLFSGNTVKGLERFRQDLATEEFNNHANTVNMLEDNRLNRIANLAGAGQTANSQIIESGRNNSNNIINAAQNRGDILAADATSGVNSFLNFVNTGANVVGALKK